MNLYFFFLSDRGLLKIANCVSAFEERKKLEIERIEKNQDLSKDQQNELIKKIKKKNAGSTLADHAKTHLKIIAPTGDGQEPNKNTKSHPRKGSKAGLTASSKESLKDKQLRAFLAGNIRFSVSDNSELHSWVSHLSVEAVKADKHAGDLVFSDSTLLEYARKQKAELTGVLSKFLKNNRSWASFTSDGWSVTTGKSGFVHFTDLCAKILHFDPKTGEPLIDIITLELIRGGYTSNIDQFFSDPAPMPICTNNAIMSKV